MIRNIKLVSSTTCTCRSTFIKNNYFIYKSDQLGLEKKSRATDGKHWYTLYVFVYISILECIEIRTNFKRVHSSQAFVNCDNHHL